MKYYVYLHLRADTLEPFYVGKGSGRRAYVKAHKTAYWKRIVEKHGYIIKFLETELSEDASMEREIYWINHFGRKDLKKGTLVNLTNGGEATSGYSHTEKSKEQMSLTRKGRKNSELQKVVVGQRFKGKFGAEHNRSKSVLCIENGIMYGSMSEAARETGLAVSSVHFSAHNNIAMYGKTFQIKE